MTCIFCKIANGDIPTDLLLSNDKVVAFRDIRPAAPTHILVVPKAHVASLWELDDHDLAGALLSAAAEIARSQGLSDGFRVVINTGHDGGQEVPHLHLHIVGGHRLGPMLSPKG
jgi:histidine triad (HIT) family protein